jgi:metal-responsive CopG/Arc/MetJ family transcriptional regulator
MKTIAITIDERTLQQVDRLIANSSCHWRSRSQIIRKAVQEFVGQMERAEREAREREIVRKHRARLARQAEALIKEQAKL